MTRNEYMKIYQRKWYNDLKENHPERYRELRDKYNKQKREKWAKNEDGYRERYYERIRIWKKLNG